MRRANINGDFDIWQLGSRFDDQPHAALFADMWRYQNTTDASHRIERSLDVPSYGESGRVIRQSAKLTVTTAQDVIQPNQNCCLMYRGEGYEWAPLHGSELTLSFWAKATLPGVYYCGVETGEAPWLPCTVPFTIDNANEWRFYSLSLPRAPLDGGWTFSQRCGYSIYFFLCFGSSFFADTGQWNDGAAAGASDGVNACAKLGAEFLFTGVQLEKGHNASPFETRHFRDELFACQRYIETSWPNGLGRDDLQDARQSAQIFSAVGDVTTGSSSGTIGFVVPKRTTPNIELVSPVGAADPIYNLSADHSLSGEITTTASQRSFEVLLRPHNACAQGERLAFLSSPHRLYR